MSRKDVWRNSKKRKFGLLMWGTRRGVVVGGRVYKRDYEISDNLKQV